jgi:Hypothetical glycosyl hydrolase family 15
LYPALLRALVLAAFALIVPAQAMAAEPVAGHLRYAIDKAAKTADYSGTASRNRFVILQSGELSRLAALKAADPHVKVLMYKDLAGMVERDPWGGVASGVSTQEADANPSWYLLDTSGRRFSFSGYGWIWAADIGDPGYQARWADNVIAQMKRDGWDGVFMDDTNPTIRYHHDVGSVAKYPTDAAYGRAMGQAVAAVGPRVRASGKLIIANMGAWRDYPQVVNGWLPYVDGGMDELFTKWGKETGLGYLWGSAWDTQLDEIKTAERLGKHFLGVTQSSNGDVLAARYGWATLLLAADGRSSFAMHGDYSGENWFPEYDYPIGDPLGAETKDASGVHRRVFSNGLVVVNPTLDTIPVSFGGRYTGCGLTAATSAELAPHSALVLVKAADVSPTPTPTPTATPTPAPTATPSPSPTASPSPAPATTPTPTPTPTPAPIKPHGKKPKGTPASKLRTVRRVRVRGGKSVRVRVRCLGATACRQRVVLRHRRVVLASRLVTVQPGCTAVVRLKLHAAGRRAVRRHRLVRARVLRVAVRGARAAIAPRRVTVRR